MSAALFAQLKDLTTRLTELEYKVETLESKRMTFELSIPQIAKKKRGRPRKDANGPARSN